MPTVHKVVLLVFHLASALLLLRITADFANPAAVPQDFHGSIKGPHNPQSPPPNANANTLPPL